MTIYEYYKDSIPNVFKSFENGFIFAQEVSKSDEWDTVVCDGPGLCQEKMYLKKISGTQEMEFFLEDIPKYNIFVLTNEQWKKMTESNPMIENERK